MNHKMSQNISWNSIQSIKIYKDIQFVSHGQTGHTSSLDVPGPPAVMGALPALGAA